MKIASIVAFLIFSFLSIGQVAAQKTFGTRNGQIIFQSPSDEDVKAICEKCGCTEIYSAASANIA